MNHNRLIIIALCCITVLCGCKKDNHDTIVLLGEESYVKTIDEVYPKQYRDEWDNLAPGYSTLYQGFIPPDITGKYLMYGQIDGCNEKIVYNGDTISYTDPANKYFHFNIEMQKNGIVKPDLCIYKNPIGAKTKYTIDTAYLYGNGTENGDFTLCLEAVEQPGDIGLEYYYGIIVTGTLVQPDDIHPNGGISNIKLRKVIKGRNDVSSMFYYLNGGQSLFSDKDNFAERVDYDWDSKDE